MKVGSTTSTMKVSGHSTHRRNVSLSWWMAKGRESKQKVKYRDMHMTWGQF